MESIKLQGNPNLVNLAERFCAHNLTRRIREILAFIRRSGATQVAITNTDGCVTLQYNGPEIDDVGRFLRHGGWNKPLDKGQNPLGFGLFSLAPRELMICSNGRKITITAEGWNAGTIRVADDPHPVSGTVLRFMDEPWSRFEIKYGIRSCGLAVTVNGDECSIGPFVSENASEYPELGAKIEIRSRSDRQENGDDETWINQAGENTVLVNYYGMLIPISPNDPDHPELLALVEVTGEDTPLRVIESEPRGIQEDEVFKQLMAAVRREKYRYLQKRGSHNLPYSLYLEARQMGIDLPEADPAPYLGFMPADIPDSLKVPVPAAWPAGGSYTYDHTLYDQGGIPGIQSVHLLAVLGTLPEPFIPINIPGGYENYRWGKLPTVDRVEVQLGETIGDDIVWSEHLVCVKSITVTAYTRDGKVFSSPVCMAVAPNAGGNPWVGRERVCVTLEARKQLNLEDIWYLLGGYYENDDTYDTQVIQFQSELDAFWTRMLGKHEPLRAKLTAPLKNIKRKWNAMTITPDGVVRIERPNGSVTTLSPPKDNMARVNPIG